MATPNVGFLEFNGKIHRFTEAEAALKGHELDVIAIGPKWRLNLYGLPFTGVTRPAELDGRVFGPDSRSAFSDPIAEGGIKTPRGHLSWQALQVPCGRYDPPTQLMTFNIDAEVQDHQWGQSGTVTGSIRCCVVPADKPVG